MPVFKNPDLDDGLLANPLGESAMDKLCRLQHKVSTLEAKVALHEEYFNTIEAILTKIQAVYEAIRDERI